ncbi:hypothetical protein [Streptomyces sp. NPDC000994]
MIVSLLYKVTRKLPSLPSLLLRGDAAKDAELLVLRHENAVLGDEVPEEVAPGWKQVHEAVHSGVQTGRDRARRLHLSRYGLDDYMRIKHVMAAHITL